MKTCDPPTQSRTSHSEVLLFAVVAALIAHPPLLLFADRGLFGVFKQFAPDAFYYLTIASHFPASHGFSFDGTHATNGFHPLWMGYLGVVFDWLTAEPEQQVLLAFGSCVAFTAVGLGLVAVVTQRLTGSRALALLSIVPGGYYLLIPSLRPPAMAPWAFINGMESSLSILIFGVLLWSLTTRSWRLANARYSTLIGLSLGLTLATLARLDDIFLFVPFALALALGDDPLERRMKRLAALCLPAALGIGAYLLANVAYAGAALPVSGTAKTGGLALGLLRNGFAVLTTLVPYFDPLGRRETVWSSEAWRILQMLLPAAGACLWLVAFAPRRWLSRPDPEQHREQIVSLLAIYVILKATFNFGFVGLWHQGHWYYPLSILILNLILAVTLSKSIDPQAVRAALSTAAARLVRLPRIAKSSGSLTFLAGILFALHHGNAFEDGLRAGGQALHAYALWSDREVLAGALQRACGDCGVVAFDDGILAYTHAAPMMNGLGLALDLEATRAKEKGELLALAYRRGYRLLASNDYPMIRSPEISRDALREELRAYIHLAREDLADWDFDVVYVHEASGTPFIRFFPQPGRAW